jgi:transposase-like protein
MRITCPFCKSQADLKPNPAQALRLTLPRYVLKCTGCERTSIRVESDRLLHELTVLKTA